MSSCSFVVPIMNLVCTQFFDGAILKKNIVALKRFFGTKMRPSTWKVSPESQPLIHELHICDTSSWHTENLSPANGIVLSADNTESALYASYFIQNVPDYG